jgi:hypothetical protein
VNYNRDIDAFPVLSRILHAITGSNEGYRSPTDMGVNRAGFAITDDEVCREAAIQEIIRRYLIAECSYRKGTIDESTLERCKLLMEEVGANRYDRPAVAAAEEYGYDLHVSGVPSLFYLRIADDPSLMLHQAWVAECVRRGVYFTGHHNHFINAALRDEDIAETIEIAKEAFAAIRERH